MMSPNKIIGLFFLSACLTCIGQPLKSPTAGEISRQLLTSPHSGGDTRSVFGNESRNIGVQKASVDLLIQFEFDSAELTADGMTDLEQLAIALKGPGLKDAKFVIEGHTDAVGTSAYNMDLSLRRAKSVIRYLSQANISAQRLRPMGFGATKLYSPQNPTAKENRRVRVVLLN
jgi:outer membrane protein OmpA-like peptidoglycan-associated protein